MAKKVLTVIKLQIPGGQANPAPPVGPALGQHGVNIMEFCKAFNAQTAQENGRITPVEITVYEDRSFDFITKTPPAAVLIKEALRIEKGSAEGDKAREAEEAGADVIGSADLAKRVEEGFTDFDVAIATPDQMGNVGRLGRILGPRGLMPNPKTGTVTFDVAKAVRDAKAGKLEYRTDRGANVHIPIGKKSFDERALVENYAALLDEIVRAKPAAAKGRYIKKITLTSTMGPGIHVDPTRTRDIAEELETQGAEQAATVGA